MLSKLVGDPLANSKGRFDTITLASAGFADIGVILKPLEAFVRFPLHLENGSDKESVDLKILCITATWFTSLSQETNHQSLQ